MNYTLRVRTANRSLIVKQARGYVEKYPSIAAPVERATMEGLFYREIAQNPELRAAMPELLAVDETENLLLLEDLGEAADFTSCYQPGQLIQADEMTALTTYLSVLHNQFLSDHPQAAFANHGMRALNHEHIFVYPFLVDNGFNLDTVQPGLQALALLKRPARFAGYAAAWRLLPRKLAANTCGREGYRSGVLFLRPCRI
jgi:5-methylthioribose kinase